MTRRAMISVAGIRGVVGQTLTAEDFLAYSLAFGTMIGGRGKVVVGRDARPSGEMIRDIVVGGLLSTGCEVVDLGIVPTPTIGVMVSERRARGGVAITASHNPMEWNALKFFRPDGSLQRPADHEALLAGVRSGKFRRAKGARWRPVEQCDAGPEVHVERVLRQVNAETIREREFCVVVDCCNSAGGRVVPKLLEALGCRVSLLFEEMGVPFQRVAEPLPENLTALSDKVRREGADMGFALDPDADRLAIVDEMGRPLGDERTITLAAYHVLARKRSPLVVNLSTTRAIDDVGRMRGVRVHRTAVGEAHVVEGMRRRRAAIGGEGNGGVIYPKITMGRDAAAAVGLILDALAETGESIATFNRRVPDYVMLKKKLPRGSRGLRSVFARLEKHLGPRGRVNRDDGLRIDLEEGWFHLRPSATEPIVRLYVEARTAEQAEHLAGQVSKLL